MKPDRRQPLKVGADAPPLRGFDLDRLPPSRWGLSKRTRAGWGRGRAPIRNEEVAGRGLLIIHWEQGSRQPEGPTRAYLLVIDSAPKAVQKALQAV